MTNTPNLTIAIVDCHKHDKALTAIMNSLEQITPHSVLFFTDKHPREFKEEKSEQIEFCILPEPIKSKEEYSEFIITQLWRYVTTSHVLIIQHDGYVLDGSIWSDAFLEYDYIGAPWLHQDGRNVGNGGFSLRSKRLMHIMASDDFIQARHPEDEVIGRLYRGYLEGKYKIQFAPEEIAHRFAYELHMPRQKTFGFHGYFHQPFRERIVVKRSGAMGDIVMMEPLLRYLNDEGYHVIVDIPGDCYGLFDRHYFPVYHVTFFTSELERIPVIDLDMAYENKPNQLALRSYFEAAGIKDCDAHLKNPKLNFPVDSSTKLFDKYVVLHIDDTAMPHRNVHGVDWDLVIAELLDNDYRVIQIGNGAKKYQGWGAIYMNCPTKNMMMYVLAGAEFFVGIDSGPSQVAVALGIKSHILFGSVTPEFRYPDFTNIFPIQAKCPIGKDGCYHSVIGVRGVDCEVDAVKPPCITHSAEHIISQIL